METAQLVLEDGRCFEGVPFGARGDCIAEVVFNTSLTGYQEILTDPSYAGQAVVMTCPHIGNTGVNAQDEEGGRPWASALVVRELCRRPSSFRSREPLGAYCERRGVVGLSGVDTRALTRHLRSRGVLLGAIAPGGPRAADEARSRLRGAPPMAGRDLVAEVSCREPYEWTSGQECPFAHRPEGAVDPDHRAPGWRVVVVDYGVKHAMLRYLVEWGCRVTVVPATWPAEEVLRLGPRGVMLSNGPGDPEAVVYGQECVRSLVGRVPVFGICMGHQVLGLALGARTFKLKFGHRGANHPVRDELSGRVIISSQNHGFAVDPASLPPEVAPLYVNLNDGTLEGLLHHRLPVFSAQYHPEASPGPHDAHGLFGRFVEMMRTGRPPAA
ncbi:MAG: glutamine-hydrolyzing carbamoyl-phosphate synthase small subunit [Planctomycetes bacterium]|nr:glutamine-hydrolyzing carbamoyl-phosphate synthase small subunit [Planctomycetota bacterium]